MKLRIFLLFMATLLFVSVCQAKDAIKYDPKWEVGDVLRYETKGDFSFYSPAHPFAPLFKDRTIHLEMVTRHEIIGQDNQSTEFKVTLESFSVENHFLEDLVPNWRTLLKENLGLSSSELETLLLEKGAFSYRIDHQGKLLEITHLEDWAILYNDLSLQSGGKIPPISPEQQVYLLASLDEKINHSKNPFIGQSINFIPHLSPFYGNSFVLGENKKTTWKESVPALPEILKSPLTFSLNGTTNTSKNQEHVLVETNYLITEKELTQWGDQLMPQLILSDYQKKEITGFWKEWKKSQPLSFGSLVSASIQFDTNGKSADQFEYSAVTTGEIYPHRLPKKQTAFEEPVPFEAKFSLSSKKLTDTKKTEENNHEN